MYSVFPPPKKIKNHEISVSETRRAWKSRRSIAESPRQILWLNQVKTLERVSELRVYIAEFVSQKGRYFVN